MSDRHFLKKKEWIWGSILIFGGIIFVLAVCVDIGKIEISSFIDRICKPDIRSILWQASETICNTVVTYSTMLVAVVVFFYSMIDSKRLGIPYRRLITYTIGSHTIPILFMAALLLSFFIIVTCSIPLKYTTYACALYIFLIQIFVVIEILRSTSYQHCKHLICKIEKKRYMTLTGLKDGFNTEWAYSFGHLERAIHSEEFIPDKAELLTDFLWIPFCRRTGRMVGKRKLVGAEQLERLYQFYFVNILSAFQDFNEEARRLERNQLYKCIIDFVSEWSEKNKEEIKNGQMTQQIYHAVLSGIMNGLASSNVEDSEGVCSYILSKGISDKDVGRKQVYLFTLFQELLSMIDIQMVSKNIKVKDFMEWEPVKMNDVEYCAKFWEMWVKMYDFSFADRMKHFEAAMQTMSGHRNASIAISKMILTMKEG